MDWMQSDNEKGSRAHTRPISGTRIRRPEMVSVPHPGEVYHKWVKVSNFTN